MAKWAFLGPKQNPDIWISKMISRQNLLESILLGSHLQQAYYICGAKAQRMIQDKYPFRALTKFIILWHESKFIYKKIIILRDKVMSCEMLRDLHMYPQLKPLYYILITIYHLKNFPKFFMLSTSKNRKNNVAPSIPSTTKS